MNFLKRWFLLSKAKTNHVESTELLVEEIEKAKLEWISAQEKLNVVTDKDQIDYAIFALEAAEKRYEMLIREAKKMNIHALKDRQSLEE